MAWFKTTDTLMGDPKVMGMPMSERGMALGTWIACGTWSSQQLTDGKVPAGVVESFVGTLAGAETLVVAGMWRRVKNGYVFVNWAKYQPTRAEIIAQRDAEKKRVAEWRANKKGVKPQVDSEVVTPYVQDRTDGVRVPRPGPSRPVPSRPEKKSGHLGGEPHISRPDRCEAHQDVDVKCGACAGARRSHEKAAVDAAKAKTAKQRAADTQARREREAEAAAIEPASPEVIEAAKAQVRAALKTTKREGEK